MSNRPGVVSAIASDEFGFALFNQVVQVKRLKLLVISISIVCALAISGLLYVLDARAQDRREALELLEQTKIELNAVSERLESLLQNAEAQEE